MKKALTWAVFLVVCLGLAKLASAVGNPWAAANVFSASDALRARQEEARK